MKEASYGSTRIKAAYLGSSLLWQYDSTAPALTVSAPAGTSSGAPTYYTGGTTYRVSGTVSDAASGVAAVYVNGAVATVSGSSWYKDITLTANSTATVQVYAVDHAGNRTATVTRYVQYDSAAPSLAVTNPGGTSSSSPTYTTGSSYTVSGTASDASGLKSVTVNGTAVSVGSDGSWSRSVSLSANTATTITVVATDNAGRTTTVTRYVYYDSAAPSLTVSAPSGTSSSSPTLTTSSSYTISGTASDTGSGLKSVTVNGTAVTVGSNGAWSRPITLSANTTTTITVVATDKAGRTTTITRYVMYDSAAPSLSVTAPAGTSSSNPTVVTSGTYTVSGTASDASGIKSVTVNGSAATVSGTSWSKAVSLSANTTTTITVVATDNAGRTTTVTRYVRYVATLATWLYNSGTQNVTWSSDNQYAQALAWTPNVYVQAGKSHTLYVHVVSKTGGSCLAGVVGSGSTPSGASNYKTNGTDIGSLNVGWNALTYNQSGDNYVHFYLRLHNSTSYGNSSQSVTFGGSSMTFKVGNGAQTMVIDQVYYV